MFFILDTMNILEFSRHVQNEQSTVAFLRAQNILKNELVCCNNPCSKVGDISLNDGEIF